MEETKGKRERKKERKKERSEMWATRAAARGGRKVNSRDEEKEAGEKDMGVWISLAVTNHRIT